MAGEYLLNWTDDGTIISSKTPMVLTVNTKDVTRTPIVLVGKGTPNYGEQLLENMLHILENFASTEEPPIKTVGMLWYNHGVSTTDTTAGVVGANLPIQTRNKSLNYYDGSKWVEVITKEDLARFHLSVKNTIAANYAAINASTPKNGDIKTDANGRVFLRSNNDWRMIWPTLVSDLYLDTKAIDTFIGVDSATPSVKSFVGFGALVGKGFGDIGYGQTQYSIVKNGADFRTSILQKTYLQSLIAAIYDVADYSSNDQIKSLATDAKTYFENNTADFYPANLGIFDRSTLDSLYSDFARKNRTFKTQLILSDASNNSFTSAVSQSPMTIESLTNNQFIATYDITFANADAARAFFNTGGEVRCKLNYAPSVTVEDNIFKTFISDKVGLLSLSAHDCLVNGGKMIVAKNIQVASSNDDSSSFGYYELPQWTGNASDFGTCIASTTFEVGAEVSSRVDVSFYACTTGSTANGANGETVKISAVFKHYEAIDGNLGYGAGYGISGIVSQKFDKAAIIAKPGVTAKISLIKAASPFIIDTPLVTLSRNFQ